MILVEARNLTKIYHRDTTEVVAFRDATLDIYAGEFAALMGPSGSGKSTLLNIIAGIDRPTNGEIRVLGINILDLREDELAAWRSAHIGYVFQTFNLIPVLNAYENVELPLLLTRSRVQSLHAVPVRRKAGADNDPGDPIARPAS